jgi:hypothetical protein
MDEYAPRFDTIMSSQVIKFVQTATERTLWNEYGAFRFDIPTDAGTIAAAFDVVFQVVWIEVFVVRVGPAVDLVVDVRERARPSAWRA